MPQTPEPGVPVPAAPIRDEPLRRLRCEVCRRIMICTSFAVRAYAALRDWPRCCGGGMTLLIRVAGPVPDPPLTRGE